MSEIKVNKISPRAACGTVQLGDSGDTFTIPAGASITNSGTASGFGATGAASWNTTVKTGDFTAVAGEGYFVNTTSGAINVTLPAGTAGAVVAIKDYAGTFDTNKVTLTRNGSDKIGGQAINASLTTEGQAITLVFVDSTQGWLVTDDGLQSSVPTPTFITATGGTITCSGNFKIHTFTGPGSFCVSAVGNPAGSSTVDYLVVAGGAGGGGGCGTWNAGGGGGAGGYRESSGADSGCYTISPLGACVSSLPVSVQAYPIVVGAGGAASSPTCNAKGSPGGVSTFSTITSAGGGGGGSQNTCVQLAANGGSGGGGGQADSTNPNYPGTTNKGIGNTPPVSPPQGNPGGDGTDAPPGPANGGGGGGGALSAGGNAPSGATGGAGGGGATSSINGTPTARAGGGGGAGGTTGGAAGSGGGGAGNGGGSGVSAGGVNLGGGGGGGGGTPTPSGAAGGSGIVIIRYRYQ